MFGWKRIGLAVAAIVATALLFGSAVGVSFGGTDRIDAPMTFEVTSGGLDGRGAVWNQYPLRDAHGKRSGFLNTLVIPDYRDVDGNPVATDRITCTDTRQVGIVCMHVWSFESGPHTQRGTVTLSGIFRSPEPGTLNRYAVTGGTGAYSNVRGYATERVGRRWVVTFHLTP